MLQKEIELPTSDHGLVTVSKLGVLAEPVLVGREKELEQLESFLTSTIAGKGKTVFVSGEAGSGKTRLTREFLEAAEKKGVAVIAGWCLSDAAAPYFPFVEAFNAYFASFEHEEPADLQKPGAPLSLSGAAEMVSGERGVTAWFTGPASSEKLGRPQVLSPQVWKDQVFARVARTLHEISVQSPTVLFIEDIHWADSASLALLNYIARAVYNSEKTLVLATFRSEELVVDAEGRPHPLTNVLRMMRREDLFTEIKLSNLDQVSVSGIAEKMVGGVLEAKLAEKLAVESRGNPLFVVESLRMLHERRSLVQENNEWRLTVDELGIPTKIRDIILRRLSVLKYAQRRVLDAASVIGEKFDVELLSTVLGLDSLEVLETLNVVARSTSLVNVEENCYRFDHAKSRETLYEELSIPLKRGYHARIAEKLELSKGAVLPLSDLAYHFAQAGNIDKAVEYSLTAGQDALARWSNEEAIKHFTYVLASVPENPENVEARRKAQEGLGDAYYASSMFKQATRVFEDLSNSEMGVIRLRALRKAMESTFQYRDTPHMIELVKKAEPYAATDRLESARVLMQRGRVYYMQDKLKLALEDYVVALRVFEEEYSLWDAALALIGTGRERTTLGEPQKGIAESLRAIALFEELGDSRFQMEACWVAGLSFLIYWPLPNEALSVLTKVIEIDEKTKMGDYQRLVYANALSSLSYEQMGNWGDALSHSLKAQELLKKTDNLIIPGIVYSGLSKIYVRLGDLEHGEEYFEKLMKLRPEALLNPSLHVELVKAVFFAGKNQWMESNRCFKGYFEWVKSDNAPGMELIARLHFAWALEKQGRFEEAKVQFEDVQKTMGEVEERLAHVNLQGSLMVRREVRVGEEVEMRLDLVNVSRKQGLLVKAEGIIPSEGFKVIALSPWCNLQNGSIEMKKREIGAFKVEAAKLTLQAVKAGTLTLNPKIVYIDELGETKTVDINPVTITVQPAQLPIHVLPERISSGFDELDDLLGGGIPEKYAVVLASPSIDERAALVEKYLEAGANLGEMTFCITVEARDARTLAEQHPLNFYLFVCNIQADAMVPNLPNIFKLKGIESLTEIDIALTKAFRGLNPSATGPKRICIEILSDVLLQHHAVTTRKWLSALLPNLKVKGFTTLAVIDQNMHPAEEAHAILSLFDGEIRISEKETPNGLVKILRIRKLTSQRYSENELVLTKEKLSPQLQKSHT